jgi:ABC-2 type transport system ATP-binding protein
VVLTAQHLTRRFGNRVAVDDLSFDLLPGEIFALLGPNGAGKTTTLRMVAGLIEPSSGHVTIGGKEVTRHTASGLRSQIGFLTEMPGLWDRLTVTQNLLVYARLHRLPHPHAAIDQALDLLDLRDRAGDPAVQLSKGLRQRVALARTLLHRPTIVLLDEPTAGLDPESACEVRELILRLRSERRTIVLSTHNLDEVERVANRVAVMRTRLVALDTPAALRVHLFGARLRIVVVQAGASFVNVLEKAGFTDVRTDGETLSIGVDDPAADAPLIVRRLVEAGASVVMVMPEQPSLEEVYLTLMRDHKTPEAVRS